MDVNLIRACFSGGRRVLYSRHARREMTAESTGPVSDEDLGQAVEVGEVIEDYSDDKPYPSCLLFGRTRAGRPLHAVLAYSAEEMLAVVVTVYEPDPLQWDDLRRRKP